MSQTFEELLIQGEEKALDWETEEALELLTRAVELQPKSAKAYYLRGFAASISNPTKGLEDFLKAIELDPLYEEAYQRAASCYSFVGNEGKASEYEKKAIELNPESARNLMSQGQFKRSEGQLMEALEYYDLSIERHDEGIEWIATSERAEVKFLLGDFKGAIEDFEKCFIHFGIGIYSSKQYEMCGDAHYELNNAELACKRWRQAFYDLDPEFYTPSESAKEKFLTNKCGQ